MTGLLIAIGGYVTYDRFRTLRSLAAYAACAFFLILLIISIRHGRDANAVSTGVAAVSAVIWTAVGYGVFVLKRRFFPLIPPDENETGDAKE